MEKSLTLSKQVLDPLKKGISSDIASTLKMDVHLEEIYALEMLSSSRMITYLEMNGV